MKQLALILIGLLTFSGSTYAADEDTSIRRGTVYDGSKYIFVENGIEFSVFPDGEFDFYIPQYVEGVNLSVNAGPVGISFNTGFDYDPYVQYDEFGAVIQIENTPLFYDYYGRLSQAGDIRINYRNNRIARVGGLQIFYNNRGFFSHHTGFINLYNRNYVFHPFHNFYYRPLFNRCLVFNTPYRRFYNPVRYNYAFHRNNYYRGYNNGYANGRRDFRRPDRGRVAHNNGRRDNVDRNNARFTSANTGRRVASTTANRNGVQRSAPTVTNRETTSRRNRAATTSRNGVQRGAPVVANRETTSRSNRAAKVSRDGVQRGRPVTTAPTSRKKGTAVSRSGNTSRPVARTSSERSAPKATASKRSSRPEARSTQRSTRSKATSSRGNSSRKVSTNRSSSRKAAPQRASRSSNSKSTRSSSSRSKRG